MNPKDSASWKYLTGAGTASCFVASASPPSLIYIFGINICTVPHDVWIQPYRRRKTASSQKEEASFTSSWCLVFPWSNRKKTEFQDVLLIKLKVVHEGANAMTKTFLLKSCSWSPQNCRGIMCVRACAHVRACACVCMCVRVCCMSLLKSEMKTVWKAMSHC